MAKSKPKPKSPFAGRWRIVSMRAWDEDYIDEEEEGYFVLDGELTLTIGDQSRALGPGDFGHVAPRTMHGYANAGTAPVRFLAWTVGGPIDRFFEAMSERVKEMPRDAGAMAEITARFGVEMAGPPA